MNETAFREERMTGIGGSDIACLLGLSPFGGPADVYMQKMGMDEGPSDNSRMAWGRRLEPAIAQMYAEDKNVRVVKPENMLRHPKKAHIIGHPDGIVFNGGPEPVGLLEIKTVGIDQAYRWSKTEGGDGIPDHVNLQVQHYMLLTGLPWCDVVPLIGGNEDRYYRVSRHDAVIEKIIETCDKFWFNHIVPKIPPPVDDTDGSTKLLKKLYHDAKGGTLLATEETAVWGERFLVIREEMDELEKEQTFLKNKIMEQMVSATYFEGPFGRFSWTEVKGRDKIDWPGIAAELKIPKETIKLHTKTGEPTRRFNPPRSKK